MEEMQQTQSTRKMLTKKLDNIVSVIEWTVFGFLLILFGLLMLPILPIHHVVSSYIVPTGSMEPTIGVGSLVLTIPPDSLQKNDIIAFTDPKDKNKTIIHRIVSVDSQTKTVMYETKGDNNNAHDPWVVPASYVKGRLLLALPYLGYISADARTPQGFTLIIIVPSFFLVLLQFKKIKQGIEQEVAKKTSQALQHAHIPVLLLLFGLGYFTAYTVRPHRAYAAYTTIMTVSHVGFSIANQHNPTVLFKETDDKKSVWFVLTHLKGYDHLHYQLIYDTNTISQEVQGEASLTGKLEYTSPHITLGTCSQEICVYDKGVKNLTLTVILSGISGTQTITKNIPN